MIGIHARVTSQFFKIKILSDCLNDNRNGFSNADLTL